MTPTTTFTEADRAMACALGAQVAVDRFARLMIADGRTEASRAKGKVATFVDETERTDAEKAWFAMMDRVTVTRPPVHVRLAAGEVGPFFTKEG